MLAFKGILLTLLGAFQLTAAQSWSNAQSTKTLEPSAVGTTTTNGAVLVSMDYCTIIMNTQCQVSVLTSALPAPATTAVQPAPVTTSFTVATSTVTSSSEIPSSVESSASETTEPASTSHSGTPAVTTSALTAAAAGIKAFPGAAWGAAILAIAMLL